MIILMAVLSSTLSGDHSLQLLQLIYLSVRFYVIGRVGGYRIDVQYREPEGKPDFVRISDNLKWLFRLRYFSGNEVVKAEYQTQLIGYICATLEFCLLLVAVAFSKTVSVITHISWGVLVIGLLLIMVIVLLMALRYNHNLQTAFDCDWVTQLQRAFSLLPKRRCYIVSVVSETTYEIILGRCGKKEASGVFQKLCGYWIKNVCCSLL